MTRHLIRRDPLQLLVDMLAVATGAALVATLVAEHLWRQVRPDKATD